MIWRHLAISSGARRHAASPARPARAVRPLRCTKMSERKKAEEALARAAKLAEHTMASIKRGENKTDEELAIEVFGEDYVPEPEKEDDRSLPSKRLPSAAACLFLFLVLTFHALYHLMCRAAAIGVVVTAFAYLVELSS